MEQPMGWGKARKCGGQKTKLKKKKKRRKAGIVQNVKWHWQLKEEEDSTSTTGFDNVEVTDDPEKNSVEAKED